MSDSVYLRGQPINVVKRFFDVDPLTGAGTPEDPDVVTFSVLDPDDGSTDYVFGIDSQVSNPATGVYLLQLPPLSPVGAYRWRCASSGSGLIDAEEGAFDVIESGVLPPDPPKVAVDGPCSSWINGDDVANQGPPIDGIGSDTWLLDDVAYDASSLLYGISGRQYPGVCERTVRPCSQSCSWSGLATWGTPFYWTYSYFGWGWGWGWQDGGGLSCGCQPESVVRLAGYPVRDVLSVKIGGVALPEFDPDSGYRNWRLDDRRDLVRMNLPGQPTNVQAWPACVAAGTLVTTETGQRPVEDIRVGERVLTHRGRWKTVVASRMTGIRETVAMKGHGATLRCTPDHELLLCQKTSDPVWGSAESAVGSFWATPSMVEQLHIPLPHGWEEDGLPDQFWWIVGRWVGDGWVDKANRVNIACGMAKREVMEGAVVETGWDWRESGGNESCTRFRYHDAALGSWLTEHFGKGAHGKSLPSWLYGAPETIRRDFLDGYVHADGHWHQGEVGRPTQSARTVSRRLAVSIKMLAVTLGFVTGFYEDPKLGTKGAFRVNWPEGKVGEPYSQGFSADGKTWLKVKRVVSTGIAEPVYDLEVQDDHSFVAEGVIVHNCQDLSLDDDQPGTFSIQYTWGADAPSLGRAAACQLARELWAATNGGKCALPQKATRVVRQGITIDRVTPLAQMLRQGATGLTLVDAFIAKANPIGMLRRPAVYSPDVQAYGKKVGQD